MTYAYYPGCASESTARDQHLSSMAVARALNLDLAEIPGWTCCGATPAHHADRALAAALAAANLIKAGDRGMEVVVNCAACFNRLKTANHEVLTDPGMREAVARALGRDYDGTVRVRHLVEVILEEVGLDRVKQSMTASLNGLRVAAYYGCLLVRPHGVTGFDDPENPQTLDTLVSALGGTPVAWPCKTDCCGNALSVTTRSDLVVGFVDEIIAMARAAGAQCMVVACPFCQVNLDVRQLDILKKQGVRHDMPILYITQLLGLCLGLGPGALGLDKLVVPPVRVQDALAPRCKDDRSPDLTPGGSTTTRKAE